MAITSLYEPTDYEGPFASVRTDTFDDTEDVATHQRPHRRAVRAELDDHGAAAPVLDTLDAALRRSRCAAR